MGERGKEHDIYDPGVTDEQRESAEKFLGNVSFGHFVEQRELDGEFRPGLLIPLDGSDPIEVAVSPVVDDEVQERVVLCEQHLSAMPKVQLVVKRAGQQFKMVGNLTNSSPGRRAEDRKAEPPVQVARFYEKQT